MKKKFAGHYGQPGSVAEGLPPSLDTQETSVPSGTMYSYREFLISGIPLDVDKADRLYTAIDERDDKHRVATFRRCRTSAWFVRHRVTGLVRIASGRCNLRWCPLCIKTKRFIMQQSLRPWVARCVKPKFITLTLKHSDATLSHQIDSLYNFFRTLRRRPFWKSRVKGGVWFFQVKKSKSDGRWHPHLHLICEGSYLPQDKLSSIWGQITHGSSIVDIRAVKDHKKAVEYVSRYATSPCRLLNYDDAEALEVVDAMHGRRICGTFGTAKVVQLVPKRCPDSDFWEPVGSFWRVMTFRSTDDFFSEVYNAYVQDRVCYSVPPEPPPEHNLLQDDLLEVPSTYRQFVFEFSGRL